MSCLGDTSPSEVDLLSCKGSGLLGHPLLLGPLLSVCLSLAAVSLRSVQTPSPACPSAPQFHPVLPGQGLPALTREPCFFFLPAAQVLPQRAPDAAGAEGGAGLPVPECELRTRVVRQHEHWLGHLRVSHSCCPAPHLGTVVPRHCSCPWLQMGPRPSHASPRAEQHFFPNVRLLQPLFALQAVGNLLLPKAGGVCLLLPPLDSRGCGRGRDSALAAQSFLLSHPGCAEKIPDGAKEQGGLTRQVPGRAEETSEEEPRQQKPPEIL